MKASLQNLFRMKNNYLLLLLLAFMGTLLFNSCKKEMQENNLVNANSENTSLAKSKIIYTDINPDVTETADQYSGAQYYYLDLNNDDTTDFEIRAYQLHYY